MNLINIYLTDIGICNSNWFGNCSRSEGFNFIDFILIFLTIFTKFKSTFFPNNIECNQSVFPWAIELITFSKLKK